MLCLKVSCNDMYAVTSVKHEAYRSTVVNYVHSLFDIDPFEFFLVCEVRSNDISVVVKLFRVIE